MQQLSLTEWHDLSRELRSHLGVRTMNCWMGRNVHMGGGRGHHTWEEVRTDELFEGEAIVLSKHLSYFRSLEDIPQFYSRNFMMLLLFLS